MKTDTSDMPASRDGDRLLALGAYAVMDTLPETDFDDIARLAAEVCRTSTSLVTLVDGSRQFFKARVGFEGDVISPLEVGFCPLVVDAGEMLVIPDTTDDPKHAQNIATRLGGVRFYAGVPLRTRDGHTLGTLCVLDPVSRPSGLDPAQVDALRALSRQVMTQLDLRRALAERDEALQQKRIAEVRHKQILESAVDYAIVTTALDGTITSWSSGAEQVLGWSEPEVVGSSADIFFTPEDRADDRPEKEMRAAREKGRGMDERWHLRKDRTRFWGHGEMMPLTSEDGKHVGYLKIMRDRTRERQQEERVHLLARAAAELLAAPDPDASIRPILEAGTDALGFDQTYIYTTSPESDRLALTQSVGLDGEILGVLRDVSCNLPLCGIVAQTKSPLILTSIQKSEEPRHALAREAGLDAYAGYPVLTHGRLSGVISFASLRLQAFDAETLAFFATIAHFLAIARERLEDEAALRANETHLEEQITVRTSELMRAEEALRQSQKMEAIGQLTGGVAHDFNNLLTVIRGSVDLLRRGTLAEDRRERHLQAISDTVTRAARLTSQLLAFARRQTLQPEAIDVGKSMTAISEMLSTLTGSRIEIIPYVPAQPCFVNVDPTQFDTALVNMAVNARDAMNGEGTLTLRAQPTTMMPSIRNHPAVKGDFVAVSLTDTGGGIPADQLEHIFEPFFTTKAAGAGTGLGLSQVFGFAKQSGGEVTVESDVGAGATFTLYLPRVEAPTQVARAKEPEQAIEGNGTSVLLVEDNEDVGGFANQALADLGFHAVWVVNAEGALTELDKDATRFDVVFSDVIMPGMNGIDLAHEIGRRYPGLPIVLTSGYSAVLAQGGTHGFDLLHKPYSVEAMSRALARVAEKRH